MNWLNVLIGPLTDAFSQWRTRRHEIKVLKHQREMTKIQAETDVMVAEAQAQIELKAQAQAANINWELMSIQNSGWRDEYVTILFTLPYIAVFLPWTQDYVKVGFDYVGETPFWYQMVLLSIIGSALGVRIWDAFAKPLMARKGPTGGEA